MATQTITVNDLSERAREEVLDLAEQYYCYLENQESSTLQDWLQAIEENPSITSETIGLKNFLEQCKEKTSKQALYRLGLSVFYSLANPEISEDDPRVALK